VTRVVLISGTYLISIFFSDWLMNTM